ncbi:MAG: hypothetical protein WBA73_04905 [Devosia sp.]
MATVVRLTQDQIEHLLDEADQMERSLKEFHEELVSVGTPKETLLRFNNLHDRFTGTMAFLRRQRELGGRDAD